MKRGRDVVSGETPTRISAPGAVNLVNYSTDSLLKLLRRTRPETELGKKGDLLSQLFLSLHGSSLEQALVTTPDVLHLMQNKSMEDRKCSSGTLAAGGLFVFDEFHLYHKLKNFVPLLEEILTNGTAGSFFFPATPVESQELRELFGRFPPATIRFLTRISVGTARRRGTSHLPTIPSKSGS